MERREEEERWSKACCTIASVPVSGDRKRLPEIPLSLPRRSCRLTLLDLAHFPPSANPFPMKKNQHPRHFDLLSLARWSRRLIRIRDQQD